MLDETLGSLIWGQDTEVTQEEHEKVLIDLETTRVLEVGDKVHDTEVISTWTRGTTSPKSS